MFGAVISFIMDIFKTLAEATEVIPWLSNLFIWIGTIIGIGAVVLVGMIGGVVKPNEDEEISSEGKKRSSIWSDSSAA